VAGPDLVISGARVITPEGERPAAVVVEGGAVVDVLSPARAPRAGREINAGSAVVMPGVIDPHVHINQPGRTEWEGFETATRAAAAGGVTTLVDMPLNCLPVTTTARAVAQKQRAANGRCLVDVGTWGGVIPDNQGQLRPMLEAGVLGFKCFLVPSGIPEFPPVGEDVLRPAMAQLAELGAVLLVHAELPGPIERAAKTARTGDPRRYARYLASRPAEAELEAIDLVLSLAGDTGCRVHIVHLSAAAAVDRLRQARQAGVRVTVETCPHYLALSAQEIPDGATVFKCAPPIRDRVNQARLWEALRAGVIDLVASDHSPCPPAMKCSDSGDFFQAWGGIASLGLSLPVLWTAGRDRGFGPADLSRWLSEAPARLTGLAHRKGRIAPGFDADLVIFDPDARIRVESGKLHQRHPVTPYAGRDLLGQVTHTFVRGTRVFAHGAFPSPPAGRWLSRGAS
jgi:allantoinase